MPDLCFAVFVKPSSSFAGFGGGTPSHPSSLAESTKSTSCPTLGSDGRNETITVAEYKAWAFRARAWYETNTLPIPKKNSELLAVIRGKPAQVIAVCVPIELALGIEGAQKIGEALGAHFGVDGCEGLLSAVKELMHGRRGQRPMLEYSLYVANIVGHIQLQEVAIDPRLSGSVLLENCDLSTDPKLTADANARALDQGLAKVAVACLVVPQQDAIVVNRNYSVRDALWQKRMAIGLPRVR